MQLTSFRVTNFRSVIDSTWIDINKITNIIGVNESGKSNILLALWKLRPVNDGEINHLEDLPRELFAQMKDECATKLFVETKWDLTKDTETIDILSKYGKFSPENFSELYLARNYGGEYVFHFTRYEEEYRIKSSSIAEEISAQKDNVVKLIETIKIDATDGDHQYDEDDLDTFLDFFTKDSSFEYENIKKVLDIAQPLADKHEELSTFANLLDEYKTLLETRKSYDSKAFWDTLVKQIPHFVYYSNYGNLDSEIYLPHVINNLNRTDLSGHAAAIARTLKMLFSFIKLNPQNILELGRDTLLQSNGQPYSNPTSDQLKQFSEQKRERTVLLNSASAYLTTEFRNWWKQGEYKFNLKADGNFFKIWVSDNKRPVEIELESRSTGLQ